MAFNFPPEGEADSSSNDTPNSNQVEEAEALSQSLYTRPETSPWVSDSGAGSAPNLLPKELTGSAKELKPEQAGKSSDLQSDAKSDSAGVAADSKGADNLKKDKDGYVTDINYPGGNKQRHIERDATTHEATSIVTKTADATTTLNFKDGKWSLNMQTLELPVNGQIQVQKNGDVETKLNGSNVWKIEKTDGTVVDEKEEADGSRLRLSTDGKPERLIRADQSMVEQKNENTIVESRPGQKAVTWTKDGDVWKSDSEASARRNLKLNNDGKVSFTDGSGLRHEVNTKGEETLEGDGFAKIKADALNRPKEVELQEKIRKYEYFDDKSNDVKSVTIVNKKTNQSETHTRESKDSDRWSNTNWRGDISVGADGVHSTRTHLNGQTPNENARWDSSHPDGRSSSDLIGKDGSRVSYDKGSGEIMSVRTADGVRIDKTGDDKGQSTVKYYNPRIGESVTWTKGADGKYTSDSPAFKGESRTNLGLTASGELTYQNDKGEKIQEGKDGSKRVAQPDGTVLEYGADKQLQKAIRGSVERSYARAEGTVQQVVDRDTKSNKEKIVFDAKAALAEAASNFNLAANGDFSYQTRDGAVIERANGLQLKLDRDGDMSSVSSDKGTRSFRYLAEGENKTLASITDSFETEKGKVNETYARVINPDGKLANEFRSDKGGPSRFDVTACADGDYEFKNQAGDKQVMAARIIR